MQMGELVFSVSLNPLRDRLRLTIPGKDAVAVDKVGGL
jgi:hypothetical protein